MKFIFSVNDMVSIPKYHPYCQKQTSIISFLLKITAKIERYLLLLKESD